MFFALLITTIILPLIFYSLRKKISAGQVFLKECVISCWTQSIIFFPLSLLCISFYKNITFGKLITDYSYTYWHYRLTAIFAVFLCIEAFIEKAVKQGRKPPLSPAAGCRLTHIFLFLLTAAVFCAIYGIQIINPADTGWIMSQTNDLPQHYLGWKAYRAAPWHFPIGMVNTLSYPDQTSIIFTDSIPVFAVFFKLISPLLPDHFQYFGIWGLLCFFLQACFAAKIVRHFTSDKLFIISSSVLFLFTPVFIFRMFGHSALSAQWLILWGIELILNTKSSTESRSLCIQIFLIAVLSSGIHLFFVLMNGILLIGLCIKDLLIHRKWYRPAAFLAIFLFTACAVIALLGGFSSNMQPSDEGLGTFSANLNTLFDAQGWSVLFHDLNIYKEGQIEGFGWLGAGVLLMTFLAAALYLNDREASHNNRGIIISLGITAFISFAFALSPVVTLGKNVLFVLKLPDICRDLWAIFRSSGRVIWIVVYLIMIFALWGINRYFKKDTAAFLILFLLMLQIYDMNSRLDMIYAQFSSAPPHETQLTDKDFWDDTAAKGFEHLIYLSDFDIKDNRIRYPLTDWALDNHITMNDFYFARPRQNNTSPDQTIVDTNGTNIYIFRTEELNECEAHQLECHAADGIIIGYVKE